MRIAFVSFAFGEYSIRLATCLSEFADVGLWLTTWQSDPHLHVLGGAVEFHPFRKPRMRQPQRQIPLMRRLVKEINDFRPDVVHVQQGYLWFNPVLRFLKNAPLVVTVHDPEPHIGDRNGTKTPQAISRVAFRAADHLIVHNSQMRDALRHQGIGSAPVSVVPTVARGHDDLGRDVHEEDGLVLFFGRIWRYKGLHHLIGAEPLISARIPNARFVIAGEGEDFEQYRRLIAHPDRFEIYNEHVPHDRLPDLFRRAALVVLPYIDATQSGVIATAYNFGRPVVATTVGGLPSMVDHGRTGLLVPPGDEPALADAVVTLLSDPELRHRMGRQAKQRAMSEFSPRSVAEATIGVYRATLRQYAS